jgi:hypothetical protein
MIEMKPALQNGKASSNVHSIGYDPTSKTLAVRFVAKDRQSPGDLYHYFDVEPHHHAEMMKDDVSVGSYLHANVIKAGKKFQKQ